MKDDTLKSLQSAYLAFMQEDSDKKDKKADKKICPIKRISRSKWRVLKRKNPRALLGQSQELVDAVCKALTTATQQAKEALLADKDYVEMLEKKFRQ